MNMKNWLFSLLALTAASLAGFAGLMYWMDPLLHYGKENPVFSYYEYAEMYSNPGIAKHYTYDTVMVGTSMIENTSVDLCDELLDCRMVRLPYSGGTTYNMKTILDICFESGNEIKTVYWELDQFQLTGSATEPRYPLPEYLYRYDHKKDLSYLLNLDVFYHYGVNNILGTLRGEQQPAGRRGETLFGEFGAEAVLNGYNRPPQIEKLYQFEGSKMQEKTEANLKNIETLLKEHPETEFVFFMPPFSMLYWDRKLAQGLFDAEMESLACAIERLLNYENVKLYFYQNETDIITDLDNYKDYSHYGVWINDKITQYIAENKNLVTSKFYMKMIDGMKEFVYNYDYGKLLK